MPARATTDDAAVPADVARCRHRSSPGRSSPRRPSRPAAIAAVVIAASACAPSELPVAEPRGDVVDPSIEIPTVDTVDRDRPAPASAAVTTTEPAPAGFDEGVIVDAAAPGIVIDRRLFGTNVPAWLGPERFASAWFLDAIAASGVTTIRMPGGSWSNEYDWSACEFRDSDACIADDAARPTDFAALLVETGLEGIWTISANATAESAAATVAFFNGRLDDTTEIGVDRDGTDWGTVGDWAAIRAMGGTPEPVGIELWEFGNEVYGGKPEFGGDECAPFGWEVVWTCDGTEYVEGDDEHDGYRDVRRAMKAVDPTISVGAVGVAVPDAWSDWGSDVIEAAGTDLDFYVVHQYGYDSSPAPAALNFAAEDLWPSIVESARASLPGDVPVAITEYNLVSVESQDVDRTMTRAMNALYMADTIGQLAANRVEIANQWNLANGTTSAGTDYGLVDAVTGDRFPQFEALAAWSRVGDELLEARVVGELDTVRAYPTRHADGALTVIVLQFGDGTRTLPVRIEGAAPGAEVSVTSFGADDPFADVLDTVGSVALGTADDDVEVVLRSWSISVIEVAADG
jgi:hypothetical protein